MPASGMPAVGDMEVAGGATAADALDNRGQETMEEGMHEEGMEHGSPSADLSMDLMGDNVDKFQVGDEIVFKITNIDPQARKFTVEYATGDDGGESEPWRKDLRDTMASEPTPPSTGPDQKVYPGPY